MLLRKKQSTSGAKEEDGNEAVESKNKDDAGRMSNSLLQYSSLFGKTPTK